MTIADKVKLYLVEKKIKQKELAQEIGLQPEKLSQTLNNKRKFDISEFQAVINALGVPAETFIATDYKQTG